jgi:hypothetical protein
MGPSNIWWIVGAIFIIIGIVFIILHFQKEKVSGNTTIQRVFLYGGIILLVIGVILVSFWVIKKLTGKKKGQGSSINVGINQYPSGYSNSYGYNNGQSYNPNQWSGMNQGGYDPGYNSGYNPGYTAGY